MNNSGSRWVWIALTVAPALSVVGCATTPPPPATAADAQIRSDVTDIHPMPRGTSTASAAYEPPSYDGSGLIPLAAQPVTEPAPTVAAATFSPTPVVSTDTKPTPAIVKPAVAKTTPAHGRTHIVRRGETWFAIARATYGDGSQWHRLAAANPAAAASGTLMVGQKLVLP